MFAGLNWREKQNSPAAYFPQQPTVWFHFVQSCWSKLFLYMCNVGLRPLRVRDGLMGLYSMSPPLHRLGSGSHYRAVTYIHFSLTLKCLSTSEAHSAFNCSSKRMQREAVCDGRDLRQVWFKSLTGTIRWAQSEGLLLSGGWMERLSFIHINTAVREAHGAVAKESDTPAARQALQI